MTQPDRAPARRLAQESLAQGDATGWFDALYAAAQGDAAKVPWADLEVNPNLAAWLARHTLDGLGKRALVVGCGLGDDAQRLASLGFAVTAFDVSATAIDWCRSRFPSSSVEYCTADLLHPPVAWQSGFDFVLEAYTLQSLPLELRETAIARVASFVAPGGTLLIIARARSPEQVCDTMPWPLTRQDLEQVNACGLDTVAVEDYLDDEDPPVRRFRAEYRAGQLS